MTLKEFHAMLGETVMFCQILEHDLKMIYAACQPGDVEKNFEAISDKTLGFAVEALCEMNDDRAYFSPGDYDFLRRMTGKRNHWCHEAYLEFVYKRGFETSREFADECRRLIDDNRKLQAVYRTVEDIKIKVFKNARLV